VLALPLNGIQRYLKVGNRSRALRYERTRSIPIGLDLRDGESTAYREDLLKIIVVGTVGLMGQKLNQSR
jgi:hypothetical protein